MGRALTAFCEWEKLKIWRKAHEECLSHLMGWKRLGRRGMSGGKKIKNWKKKKILEFPSHWIHKNLPNYCCDFKGRRVSTSLKTDSSVLLQCLTFSLQQILTPTFPWQSTKIHFVNCIDSLSRLFLLPWMSSSNLLTQPWGGWVFTSQPEICLQPDMDFDIQETRDESSPGIKLL